MRFQTRGKNKGEGGGESKDREGERLEKTRKREGVTGYGRDGGKRRKVGRGQGQERELTRRVFKSTTPHFGPCSASYYL